MSWGGRGGRPSCVAGPRLVGLVAGLLLSTGPSIVIPVSAHASSTAPAMRSSPVNVAPKPHVIRHRQQSRSAELAAPATRLRGPTISSSAPALGGVWSELGPKPVAAPSSPEGEVAGRVTALAVDPTNPAVVYAGSADGGVWKTTNGTSSMATWTPLTDSQVTLAIGAVALDPNSPGTIYAGTGEPNRCQDCLPSQGVLKSVDGGAHWNLLAGSPQNRTSAVVVDRSNSNRVLVATTRGLFTSSDGGASWSKNTQINSVTAAISSSTPVTGGINSLLQDPVNPRVFWAAMGDWCNTEGGSIVVSSDSGNTWVESTHFPTLPNATRLALALGKDATNHVVAYAVLAACAGGNHVDGQLLGIGKNPDADGAGLWTVIQPGPALPDFFAETSPDTAHQGWYDITAAVDPSDPNRAIFGGVTLMATTDGGTTFADIARPYSTSPLLHPDFHAATFTGPNTFYVGNDGGVWRSTDLGGTYTNLNHTLGITQFYAGTSPTTGYLLGGSQDNGTLGIVPGGPAPPAWKQLLDGDGGWTAIDPTSGSKVVWTEQTHLDLWKGTYDTPGSTWKEIGPCGTAGCAEATDFIAPFLMDPNSPARLYAGSNLVYRTIDGGSNWTRASGDLTFGIIFAEPDRLHTMALAAGATSTAVFTGSWYGRLSANAAADSTTTYVDITGNLPPYSAAADTGNPWITGLAVNPTDPSEAWATIGVASGARVWHTTNAGTTGGTVWTDMTGVAAAAIPSVVIDSVTVDPKNPQTIFIGTDAGAMVCGTCGGATAVGSWSPLGTGLPNVRVDAITLTSDDATLVAWSHGRGVWSLTSGPKASLDPASLGFANQDVGTKGAPKTITLTDNGTQPLLITGTGIAASGDFSQTNNCGAAVLPGASCTINVAFSPTATGSRTGTLSVSDNAGDSPQTATLAGTGTPPPNPYGSLVPASADFGNQEVGTTSPAKTFNLTNNGGMPLVITGVTATPDFHETDNCPRSPSSVAPGGSCSIDVTFAPSARGSQTGTLSISDNATNAPQAASLSGTGVQAGAGLSPASLAFGNQRVGTTSAGQNATLNNSGNEALAINGISTSGDFNQTNNCGSSLAAGRSCAITVTFSPTAPGSRTGTLSVSDGASGSPHTISLSGTGTQAQVTLNPASLTFDAQDVKTTSPGQTITLSNTGNERLAISGISTSGDFAQGNTCGQSVAAGAQCTINVSFTPTTAGARTGTLTINDSAPGSPQTLPLAGKGVVSFYFAEGFTAGGFDETLSLLTPNQDATATIDYYMPSSHKTFTQVLTAGHTFSESVNRDVGSNQSVSVRVTLDAMGVVERTMHFNFGGWYGSTDIVGVTQPAREWDFAEGSTLSLFSEYLTLQNPNRSDVPVSLRYVTSTGATPVKTVTLPANTRTTVEVFTGQPMAGACSISGGNAVGCGIGPGFAGVSVQVVSAGLPIIAERPFYVNGHNFGSGTIHDGHDAFGANAPAMQWNFAEGTTLPGFNEYLTLQNATGAGSIVDVHYYNHLGAQVVKTVTLPANARTTIEVFHGAFSDGGCAVVTGVGVGCGVGPGIDGVAVTVNVHPGNPPIVVERPLYMVHDFGTGSVAGAEDVVGAATLAQQFGFAWASTQPGDNDYLTIENPGAAPATITITYYGPAGPMGPSVTFSMGAHLRKTISVSDPAASGGAGPGQPQIGIIVSASQPVLVEKPTYSSNPTTYGATDTAGYSPNSF